MYGLSATQGKPEEIFQLLDIPVLRQFIKDEFLDLRGKLTFAYDLERIIDDFILMLFLCGNDFLPHLPTLEIGEVPQQCLPSRLPSPYSLNRNASLVRVCGGVFV
jgi:5'-3' exonuclease